MKALVLISIFLGGAAAQASSMQLSCTNAGRSIVVDGYGVAEQVTILVSSPDETPAEKTTFTNGEQVEIERQTLMELATESGSNHHTEFTAEKITVKPLGKTVLPDAYSRLKGTDGSLSDYFVCDHTVSWL